MTLTVCLCVCVPHVSLGNNASIVSQRAGALCRLDQGRLKNDDKEFRIGHCLTNFDQVLKTTLIYLTWRQNKEKKLPGLRSAANNNNGLFSL